MTYRETYAWAILHRSDNRLDGHREWLEGDAKHATRTLLFPSRAAARGHVADKHGYLRNRPDLREEPHGWHMPRPVQVRLTITAISQRGSKP